MQPTTKTQDQALGCLLGGALGDAWGGQWEGHAGPVDFEIPTHSEISDDTQLTLATCESIIEHGRVDPERVASRFQEWFVQGRITGIGASTLKAMRDLSAGVHWALAGNRGEYAAGNGAAMRIAPLAFVVDPYDQSDRTMIRDACRITHHNDEAYVGALAVVLAIRAVLMGTWSANNKFLEIAVDALPDSATRDRIAEILSLQLSFSEIVSRYGATGHVVSTVPLALYCAQYIEEEPLPAVLGRAISAGGDADTVASITGQIAGTVVGSGDELLRYLAGIKNHQEILQTATRFAEFVGHKK
jgi:ADP-ribosyl-[dinitrogen reductase] hydrolase